MEKSNIEKAKDIFVYAPVGAFGFVRDNAPTFYSMFVSRGRKEVTKTTIVAEEKISNTKHHGQIIAMGSDVAKDKAEKVTTEAKEKGSEFAQSATEVASELLATGTQLLSEFIENISKKVESESAPETKSSDDDVEVTEDETIAENINLDSYTRDAAELPERLQDNYEKLTAPEIIEMIEEFDKEQLHAIIKYELGYRNRQTIIHAINHRLLELN